MQDLLPQRKGSRRRVQGVVPTCAVGETLCGHLAKRGCGVGRLLTQWRVCKPSRSFVTTGILKLCRWLSACWSDACRGTVADPAESTHAEFLQTRTPVVRDDALVTSPQICELTTVLPINVGVVHRAGARTAQVIEAPECCT